MKHLLDDDDMQRFTSFLTNLFFVFCMASGVGNVWFLSHSIILTLIAMPIIFYFTLLGVAAWVVRSQKGKP